MPDMDEASFVDEFHSFYAVHGFNLDLLQFSGSQDYPGLAWFAILAGMISITLQVAPRSLRVKVYHPTLNIEQLAQKSSMVCVKAIEIAKALPSPDVRRLLRALICAISWQKNSGRAYLAQEHSNEALRLAVSIGLHQNPRPFDTTKLSRAQWGEIDRREQVWWLLYQINRNLSFLINRPHALSGIAATVLAPRNVRVPGGDESDIQTITPTTHILLGIRFCKVLDMIDETLRVIKSITHETQKDKLMEGLDLELMNFERSLPESYAINSIGKPQFDGDGNKSTGACMSRQIISIYYLEVCMLLHRPSLAKANTTTPTASSISCITAALRLIQVQQKYITQLLEDGQEHLLSWFINAFFLYDPAMSLLLAITTFPSSPDTLKWCHAVDDADKLLCSMTQLNITASTGRSVLRVFKRRAAARLFQCGKAWQGSLAVMSVADIDDINEAMVSASPFGDFTAKNNTNREMICAAAREGEILPLEYLGITVNWGLDVPDIEATVIADTATDSVHDSPDHESFTQPRLFDTPPASFNRHQSFPYTDSTSSYECEEDKVFSLTAGTVFDVSEPKFGSLSTSHLMQPPTSLKQVQCSDTNTETGTGTGIGSGIRNGNGNGIMSPSELNILDFDVSLLDSFDESATTLESLSFNPLDLLQADYMSLNW